MAMARWFEVLVVLGLLPLVDVDTGKLDTVVPLEAVVPVPAVPDEVVWLKAGNASMAAAANEIAVLRQ